MFILVFNGKVLIVLLMFGVVVVVVVAIGVMNISFGFPLLLTPLILV
jgi:hypothetical protein